MKNFIRAFLISISIIAQLQFAIAQTASILPQAETQFLDNNGKPVTSGTVDFYIPNSSTRKSTWQDAAMSVSNTNPVKLDGSGRALIYGYGGYRQVLKDRNGNLIWDRFTNSYSIPNGQVTTGDGNNVGTILQWSALTAPNQYVFAYGQELARVTYPELFSAITLVQNVNCTSGSGSLSGVADTSQIPIGAAIEASCFSASVTITGKTSTTYTVSANATVTTTVQATVFPFGNGNATTTFNMPDLRGRVLAGRDNMGGIAASRLTTTYFVNASAIGATGGIQDQTLITNNLPAYTPSGGVASGFTSTSQGGTTPGTAAAPGGGGTLAVPSGTIGNVTGAVASTFTGNAQGGTSTPLSIVQPTITINYIIKVTPDQTGLVAAGVQSIQTMGGVITCNSSLTCASQVLGVNPTGLSMVLDSAFSSTQGSILYRGTSAWAALPPGNSGYLFTTQGAGQNPVWGAPIAPPVTNQAANTVYAGPTSGSPTTPAFRVVVNADLPPPQLAAAGGSLNVIVLTPSSLPKGVTAPVDGLTFDFEMPFTPTAPSIVFITGLTGGPWNIYTVDGNTKIDQGDLSAGQPVRIRWLSSISAWVVSTPPSGLNTFVTNFGHGRYKLQAGDAVTLNLNGNDGGSVLGWDLTSGGYRMIRLGAGSACQTILNNNSAIINGVANQNPSLNTLYLAFLEPQTRTTNPFDPGSGKCMSLYAAGATYGWTDNNNFGLYVLNNNGVTDNTRIYLGMVYVRDGGGGQPDIANHINPNTNTGLAVFSHSTPTRWEFGYQTTAVSNTTTAGAGAAVFSTPSISAPTEGIDGSPSFIGSGTVSCVGAATATIQIAITGTTTTGAPWTNESIPTPLSFTVAAGETKPWTVAWDSSPPSVFMTAQLKGSSTGNNCTFNGALLGHIPQ